MSITSGLIGGSCCVCKVKVTADVGTKKSVPTSGVYGGFADKIPLGALMNKGLKSKPGKHTSNTISIRCLKG